MEQESGRSDPDANRRLDGSAESPQPALPPYGGAEWCGWADPHPPHLYAAHGGVDDDVRLYACSGEGAE